MSSEVLPQHVAATAESRIGGLADRSVPSIRPVRQGVSKSIRCWPAKSVLQLADRLLERQDVIPRWFAYELINKHPTAIEGLTAGRLKRLGRGISTWGDVDCFACYLAGPAWREGKVGDDLIHSWANSNNRWWRRAAIVSTVALNTTARGGTGDVDRTLAVCDLLVDDRDEMVVKAMSWALRALSSKSPDAVEQYLHKRADVIHSRVAREVRNKLTTGLKNPKTRQRRP